MRIQRLLPALALLISLPIGLRGQDVFEIQVYEYETVPKGMWNLETHMNYAGKGTHSPEGTVAPTNNQAHLTFELTRGITDHFELAGYMVLARRVGEPPEYVGARIRPRVMLPKSWGLPFDISVSGEVGFPRKEFEENSVTMELRPIVEKKLGRFQVDLNPTVTHALHGPGTEVGWEFEPALRLAYGWSQRLDLSLEYYGAPGPLHGFLPTGEQVHQLYPGWDLQITPHVVWNFGIGVGVTGSGDRLVYKSRLGILFGHRRT